jgi:hypothetical protein
LVIGYRRLRSFSAAWWCEWAVRVERGDAVGFMADQARRGRGFVIRRDDASLGVQAAAMVPIKIGDAEFSAWCHFYRCRYNVELPQPDKIRVIFMTALMPPDT